MAWEDVESILITRIYRKLALYDPAKPFENWANRLISHAISSLLRDHLYKHSRPCLTANPYGGECAFNLGGDRCGFTASHVQCQECPLYAKWAAKKEVAHNLNSSLPLDSHMQEVQNMQSEFVDYDTAKPIMDARIMSRLNPHEAQIYKLLFIDNLSMEQVSKRLKYKAHTNSQVNQVLRKMVIRFKQIARTILEEEGIS
jgi:RNA polymerase sigma factor (sigma-70 family)